MAPGLRAGVAATLLDCTGDEVVYCQRTEEVVWVMDCETQHARYLETSSATRYTARVHSGE